MISAESPSVKTDSTEYDINSIDASQAPAGPPFTCVPVCCTMANVRRNTDLRDAMASPVPLTSKTDSPATDSPLARKPRPNRQRALQILRAMPPEQKLAQVFKLNERVLELMRIGLRRRFPSLDDAALHEAYLQMRERCRNRNYCPLINPGVNTPGSPDSLSVAIALLPPPRQTQRR